MLKFKLLNQMLNLACETSTIFLTRYPFHIYMHVDSE